MAIASISGDSPYGSFAPSPTSPLPTYPSAAPPTAGAVPTNTATGGYQMPSLSTILGGDPLYQQALANLNAGGVQSAAQRDAARARALIQFGQAPDLSGQQGLIGQYTPDAQTLALAQQNTAAGTSTEARLQAADKLARQQIMNVLGARGLYNSGETGYQYGKEATDYRTSQYDATQKLVDYLAGVQSSYLQSVQQQQQQQYQMQLQALQSWLAMNPYAGYNPYGSGYPVSGSTTPPATTTYAAPAGGLPAGGGTTLTDFLGSSLPGS